MKSKFKGSSLPPMNSLGCQSDPSEHQIDLSASTLIEFVNRILEDEPNCDILYGTMYMVYTYPTFQTYNELAKMRVLSKVLDVIKDYPEADWREVTLMRWRIKSSTMDDSKDILSKEQVVSRVIDVVESYNTHKYKVTRRIYFYKHLNFNHVRHKYVIAALETEFKMYVPLNVDSCESAIDYIYHNQKQRMSVQEFRDQFCYANRIRESFYTNVIESGQLYYKSLLRLFSGVH